MLRYVMIPLAEPITPYIIEGHPNGWTVRHVGQPHPLTWTDGRKIIFPTRERAEMRIRTACNRD
jgi:hypothetical protein